MSKPHIILIHGAFHRAWHFHLLEDRLEKAGYKVSALDLPSTGEDIPRSGALGLDAEYIGGFMEEAAIDSASILPVFHSYGGVAGSEAVAQLSSAAATKIIRLVFLASFVVLPGSCVEELMGIKLPVGAGSSSHILTPFQPLTKFYNDLDSDLAQQAVEHLRPQARSAMTDPVQFAAWTIFPRTLIKCRDDKTISWQMFSKMSEQDRAGWEILKMDGGHSPFLSRPDEVSVVLRRFAGEDVCT
ncbi:alpha/beta-Hydrolase like protein [Zymoseptoria brevis]|uniref:Alpha/beta-Hydrolase like protein n=1 Tax=Zymoseptoria brevis TaxID=1047168 RepID=A0A0F4GHY0_9PEZI|nr:alpha/beta-Hydrolase like protein [Zymoseptoria brevis]